MKKLNKASIIQNGLTREECEAFFTLLDAAEQWREQMVRSNAPAGGYPEVWLIC